MQNTDDTFHYCEMMVLEGPLPQECEDGYLQKNTESMYGIRLVGALQRSMLVVQM